MKTRSGSITKKDGDWYARVQYIDPVTGKRREKYRKAATKAEARDHIQDLVSEFDNGGGRTFNNERRTFRELAQFYGDRYVRAATYVNERKVAGLRSEYTVRKHLDVLEHYFADRRLRSIAYSDLEKFKADRLAVPTRTKKQRSIASVHRELALLHRMFRIAIREGWLLSNPFEAGDPLINAADEVKRQRVLTIVEEDRLLAACAHPRRRHLRGLIIAALDTGCRQGELLRLTWNDVDLDGNVLTIRALNTKTLSLRLVPVTERLNAILSELKQSAASESNLVFGITDNVKRSFTSARRLAGLDDVRFHDLRHTNATRLSKSMEIAAVGRLLGHTQLNTTYRYVNSTEETLMRAKSILDSVRLQEVQSRRSE